MTESHGTESAFKEVSLFLNNREVRLRCVIGPNDVKTLQVLKQGSRICLDAILACPEMIAFEALPSDSPTSIHRPHVMVIKHQLSAIVNRQYPFSNKNYVFYF